MNPETLEQLDRYGMETLENYRNKITKLKHTIQLLKDDKVYLQKLIDRPTLSMRIMARVDVLLSYCGLKRIKGGQC